MSDAVPSPVTRRPTRWPVLRVLCLLMVLHLLLIPFGQATATGGFRDLSPSSPMGGHLEVGPSHWIAWRMDPGALRGNRAIGAGPLEVQRIVIPFVFNAGHIPGVLAFVTVPFHATISLLALAILWTARHELRHAWRRRPFMPRIRLVVERRPRSAV